MKYLNAKKISKKTVVTRFIDVYKQLKHLKFKSKKSKYILKIKKIYRIS